MWRTDALFDRTSLRYLVGGAKDDHQDVTAALNTAADLVRLLPEWARRDLRHFGYFSLLTERCYGEAVEDRTVCHQCVNPLERARRGRPPRFCSSACRQMAYRERCELRRRLAARRATAAHASGCTSDPPQSGGQPDPSSARRRTMEYLL
ncbi:hypothetical protein C5E51_34530 [Nocardia nova]|nr:hypothetical protein C5E51_34530 [Nocardia nova]